MPINASWAYLLSLHQLPPVLNLNPVLLKRMLGTSRSYYGHLIHANTYQLRRKIHHKMPWPIKRYFLPSDANYANYI